MDVAAPAVAIIDIWSAVLDGAPNFSIESDDKLAFDDPRGFRVHIDLIEIGAGFIERFHATEPLHSGTVASVLDLLLFRAVTVIDRGGDGDFLDFEWLLVEVVSSGQPLGIDDGELECLLEAVETCLGACSRFVIASMFAAAV